MQAQDPRRAPLHAGPHDGCGARHVWTAGLPWAAITKNVSVFASLLPALTLVALGLLVPASVAAVALARGRHSAASSGLDRGGRVAVATSVTAASGGLVAWLLGAGPAVALLTAGLLAAPVVAWAHLAPWWPVRAVVAWSMLVTGVVGLVGLGTARALESTQPWTAVPVAAVGAAATVLLLERLNGPFRRLLGIRAGIRRAVRTPVFLRPVLLRPALAAAVFFTALAAGGLTGVAPGPGGTRTPQAGSGPEPGRGTGGRAGLDAADVSPVSASTATPSETAAASPTSAGGSESGSGGGTAGSGAGAASGGTSTGTTTVRGAGTARTGTADSGSGSSGSGSGSTGGDGGETDSGPGGDPATQVGDTVDGAVQTVVDTAETLLGGAGGGDGGTANGGGTGGSGGSGGTSGGALDPVVETVEQTVEPVESTLQDTVDQVSDPLGSTLP